MPNHVTSRCVVTGPKAAVEAFLSQHLPLRAQEQGQEPTRLFDFNTIIPQPPGMADTVSGSWIPEAMWALGHDETGFMSEGPKSPLSHKWAAAEGITDRASCLEWLKQKHPDAIPEAKRQLKLKDETGHYNWYDWCLAKWGTKWNAYHQSVGDIEVTDTQGRLEFTFQTAWSFPEPIFEELCEQHPDLVFDCVCHDEGFGFSGAGIYSAESTTFEIFDPPSPLHYEAAHGHPMPQFDED